MAVTPHPITVTLKDTDNSTAVEGAVVVVRNVTKQTEVEATQKTNSSGVAIVDLANLPGDDPQYEDGDVTLIVAYKGNKHDAARYTVTGTSKDQTLNLNYAAFPTRDVQLLTVTTAETGGSAGYVQFWDWYNDELLLQIETAADSTESVHFAGPTGKKCRYAIVREANTMVCTAHTN